MGVWGGEGRSPLNYCCRRLQMIRMQRCQLQFCGGGFPGQRRVVVVAMAVPPGTAFPLCFHYLPSSRQCLSLPPPPRFAALKR